MSISINRDSQLFKNQAADSLKPKEPETAKIMRGSCNWDSLNFLSIKDDAFKSPSKPNLPLRSGTAGRRKSGFKGGGIGDSPGSAMSMAKASEPSYSPS
mmetsp:Transcript_29156/g.43926  ORF Transcript_29156/g.43926 Transcript_29156/m.43926 type:complete len:99 (+) Transcript_29156:3466-3762(+)